MLEPKIYDFAINNPESEFVKIWNGLWDPGQLPIVNMLTKTAYDKVKLEVKVKLTYIKHLIGDNRLRLKKDVSFINDLLGLNIPRVECERKDTALKITQDGHICVKNCRASSGWRGGNKCDTNKYSKQGSYYGWDWCDI